MDVIKDMTGRAPRFGGLTGAQATYALSIIERDHMPKLLELIAAEAAGEETVEPMQVDDAPARRRAEEEARVAARIERATERERLEAATAACATETNPLYGMF